MRNKYESKLEDLGHSSDVKLKGILEIADKLKSELSEALQSSDKHRNAVVHLKQQLQVGAKTMGLLLKDHGAVTLISWGCCSLCFAYGTGLTVYISSLDPLRPACIA